MIVQPLPLVYSLFHQNLPSLVVLLIELQLGWMLMLMLMQMLMLMRVGPDDFADDAQRGDDVTTSAHRKTMRPQVIY